jgi:hypothetical protein
MIRILDNNALVHLHDAGLSPRVEHQCFVPPEISEEFRNSEADEAWLDGLPLAAVKLDEVEYLAAYAKHLNAFSGVSFYSLKGFGDVGVLAVVELRVRRLPPTRSLSKDVFPEDSIIVVTDDRRLRKYLTRTFGDDVAVESFDEFARLCRKGT